MSRRAIVWLIGCVLVAIALILLANAWNGLWSFLPWSAESRLARSEQARDIAEDKAVSADMESQGQAEQIQRLETVHRQIITLEQSTATAIADARSAPDANEPMEAGANARLYFRDDELCGYAPRLNGCAATNPAGAR